MKIYFLEALFGKSLTKTYSLDDNGQIVKTPYPMVKHFTSHEEDIYRAEELCEAIKSHADQGHCLLKGQLDKPLICESRAGHTDSDTPTEWVVLDNDGIFLEPQALMDLLGLGNVNYVVQYSASAGITSDKNRYHIFFLLSKPTLPAELKLQLKQWNLEIAELREYVTLTNSKMALSWPLDITVCQNDKLIYIAPPICGPGIDDTLDEDRIQLVIRTIGTAELEV